jgi:glycosyltransferase involved in cell wall biosynthesis
MTPRVAMLSLWRNDSRRNLLARCDHLTAKSYPNLRHIWVVGDSTDKTEAFLRGYADLFAFDRDITIIRHDTGITAEDERERLRRLSLTANAGLDAVRADDDYLLIHESDILSPVDVVERLLDTGLCPIAAWPTLAVNNDKLLYDVWALRKDGVRFGNHPPYHACYTPDAPFAVDSCGTVWLLHAADIRAGARMTTFAAVELCAQLRAMGRTIWVDPTLEVVQPYDLWQPRKVLVR